MIRLLLLFLLLCSSVLGQTQWTSNGSTLSVSFSNGVFNWSRALVKAANGNYGSAWIYKTTGDGGPYGEVIFDVTVATQSPGTYSAFGSVSTLPGGQWLRIGIRTQGAGNVIVENANQAVYWQVPFTTYKVTFAIPANTTDRLIRYEVWQNGVKVGESELTMPGDPAHERTFDGLTSPGMVTLNEVRSNLVEIEPGVWGVGPSDYVRTVNGGTTPIQSGTSGGGASSVTAPHEITGGGQRPAPLTTPLAPTDTPTPTAPTVTPTAPTITIPVVAPDETPTTTPSGEGAATKADIERSANQISRAADKTTKAVVDTSAKQLEATDKVATAVWANATAITSSGDKVATSVNNGTNAMVSAANKQQTTLDALNAKLALQLVKGDEAKTKLDGISTNTGAVASKLDGTNSRLDTANTKLEAIKTAVEAQATQAAADKAAAQQAATDAQNSAATQGSAQKSVVEGAVGSRALKAYGNASSGSASLLSITWDGVATVDLDPSHDEQVSTLAEWMRAGIAFMILALYDWWLWRWFKDIYLALSGTLPAKGNPVAAGTGAQATSLVVAMAITGVVASLPTAFWAMADAGLTVTLLVNPVEAAASGGSALSTGLYLFNFFFPTATLLAALSSVVLVLKGGLVLLAGMQTLVRFFIA